MFRGAIEKTQLKKLTILRRCYYNLIKNIVSLVLRTNKTKNMHYKVFSKKTLYKQD